MARPVVVTVGGVVLVLAVALFWRLPFGPADVDRDESVAANLALLERLPELPRAVRLHVRSEPFWLDMGALQGAFIASYSTAATYRAPAGITRPQVVLFYRDALLGAGWYCQTAGSGAGDCRRGNESISVDMYGWSKGRPFFTVHLEVEARETHSY